MVNMEQAVSLAQILEQTISANQVLSKRASDYLEAAAKENLQTFLQVLTKEIQNEQNTEIARRAAAFFLKNQLVVRGEDSVARAIVQERWLAIPADASKEIKDRLISILGTKYREVSSTVAIAIASIAEIELPKQRWPELIPTFLRICNDSNSTEDLKIATLTTIGYVCEQVPARVLENHSDNLLTAIVRGMDKSVINNDVRRAGTKALLNSVDFIESNFARESERDYIMMVVCEATQADDPGIVDYALQCLVKFVDNYYTFLGAYMRSLFQVTMHGIQSTDQPRTVMQSIEFWITVCERESDLQIELDEATANGVKPRHESMHYALGATGYLAKLLPVLLTHQDEEGNEFNAAKSAGVLLLYLADITKDDFIPHILPFIQEHIRNPQWRFREAATLAFGTMLKGPSEQKLAPIVEHALPVLMELMTDKHSLVRDTTTWTVGRVCETLPGLVLSEKFRMNVLTQLFKAMDDNPGVANHACFAFTVLVTDAADKAENEMQGEHPNTFILSHLYRDIVLKLLQVTERSDAGESNLRASAYDALMHFSTKCPEDCYATLQETTQVIINRLQVYTERANNADAAEVSINQSLVCVALSEIIKRLRTEDVIVLSEQLMSLLTFVFKRAYETKQLNVQEDAIQGIIEIVNKLESNFKQYMPLFQEFICHGLSNYKEVSVCKLFINIVGDIALAIDKNMCVYLPMIMKLLFTILNDPQRHPSLLPDILLCFGDLASAIGPDLFQYYPHIFEVLNQVVMTQVPIETFHELEYWNSLMDAALEGYTRLILELKCSKSELHKQILTPHVEQIMAFMERLSQDSNVFHDEDVIRNCCGAIGDLVDIFKGLMKPIVSKPWVDRVIQKCSLSADPRSRKLAADTRMTFSKI